MTVNITLNKQAFAKPYFPISSQGLMYFATQTEQRLNELFNAQLAFDRQLFSAPFAKVISSNAITAPTQLLHTVTSESGVTDQLDTIAAADNKALILRATAGHIIYIVSGVGNIHTVSGAPIILAGNRAVKLWCANGVWSVVASKGRVIQTSTSDPFYTSDASVGHSPGSLWLNYQYSRAWVCVDATIGNAIWKPINEWKASWGLFARGGTVLVGEGVIPFYTAAGSPIIDADGCWIPFITGASTGAEEYIETGTSESGVISTPYNPLVELTIRTGPNIANVRYWFGWGDRSTSMTADADTLPGSVDFIGFRYSTVAGDSGWRPVLNDGTTQNTGTVLAGGIAANTIYRFRYQFDYLNSRVILSVNDSPGVIMNANMPANTVFLAHKIAVYTRENVAKQFDFQELTVRY